MTPRDPASKVTTPPASLPQPAGSDPARTGLPPTSPLEPAMSGLPPLCDVRPEIPGYEIVEELGRGGMGVVYKAHQLSLGRTVAIKVILGAGQDHLQRFHREAQAVARLHHPNLMQIHELGSHNGQSYMVLEYADGGTLSQLRRQQAIDPREAATLVETLALAIHHAHQRGILHRDLKPGNILLCRKTQKPSPDTAIKLAAGAADSQDKQKPDNSHIMPPARLDQLVPKIADFGLARPMEVPAEEAGACGERLTVQGMILGTPSYMAPEQAEAKSDKLGPATDVYALGAILYELLTGQPPFRAKTPVETLLRVVSDSPVSPRRLNKSCPRDLETICLTCLAKEPGQRYANAADLAEDLRRWREALPLRRRPGSRLRRLLLWGRRRRQLVTATLAGAGLAALLAVGIFLWWNATRAPDGEQLRSARLPADLQLIPARVHAVASVRVADLYYAPAAQALWELPIGAELLKMVQLGAKGQLVKQLGLSPSGVERLSLVLFEAQGREQTVLIARPVPPVNTDEVSARLQKAGLRAATYHEMAYFGGDQPRDNAVYVAPGGQALVFGQVESLRAWITWRELKADPSPRLATALARAAAGHEVVAYVQQSKSDLEPVMRPWRNLCNHYNLRQVPLGIDGQPDSKLKRPGPPSLQVLADVDDVLVVADRKKKATDDPGRTPLLLETRLAFKGTAQARAAQQELRQLGAFLQVYLKDDPKEWPAPFPPPLTRSIVSGLNTIQQGTEDTELVLKAELPWEPQWPAELVDVVHEIEVGSRSRMNLRRLGDAMKSYTRANKETLPPAVHKYGPAGQPLLSWRVALLPYLGQEDLYGAFKLDEPWDSPHNLKLLERMPDVYRSNAGSGNTHYQVLVGNNTAFAGTTGVALDKLYVKGFPNSLLIVEGARPVPWTKPEDIAYDDAKPLPRLGGVQKNGVNCLFADGATRYLPRQVPERYLRAIITRTGNEPVPDW